MILSIDLPRKDGGLPLNVTFTGDEADAAILRKHGYTVYTVTNTVPRWMPWWAVRWWILAQDVWVMVP